MPAARGVKRTASKASTSTAASGASKIKKKRGPTQLEIPKAPTKRGRVLTCGQGDVGQLGLGEDVLETSRFKFVAALGDKIVDAKAGGMHTITLDSDGCVWTFGCNDEGALGRPTQGEAEEGAPGKVSLPGKAVAISAGDSHSAALLEEGDVYAWGAFRDSHGSMGLVMKGRSAAGSALPTRLAVPEPAAAVASGGDHLVILTTSGGVWTLGCGEQGQLGRLSQRSASRDARSGFGALLAPSKVTLKFAASRVWAGYHATFAHDAQGDRLFAWGLNNYGQLGISGEKRKSAIFTPVECDAFASAAPLASVAPGQHHTVALDQDGAVYAVGRCEYGRLGLGVGSGDAPSLAPLPALSSRRCVSIAAGTSSSFAVTDTGEVYAWGMGSEGQLGTGRAEDSEVPLAVAVGGLSARAVAAGGQHTVLLAEDPNRVEVESPTPEPEAVPEAIAVGNPESQEGEPPAKAPRPRKRQKGEGEVTSTTGEEKVNGDEKKETAMEVDETDKTEKTQTETVTEKPKEENTDTQKSTTTKMDEDTPEPIQNSTEQTAQDSTDPAKTEPEKTELKQTPEPEKKVPEVETKVPEVETKVPEVETKVPEVEKKVPEVEKMETEVNGEAEKQVTEAPLIA